MVKFFFLFASKILDPQYSLGRYTHQTKRGDYHNWDGTSASAEGDMLNEILRDVRKEGFVLSEMVVDKDSSTNAIYCRHFPEGTVTYCSNHCSKHFTMIYRK